MRVGSGEEPARDFDPRGIRLGRPDQAGGAVALELAHLIAVDRDFPARGRRQALAAERPQHHEDRNRSHQREGKPQRHCAVRIRPSKIPAPS